MYNDYQTIEKSWNEILESKECQKFIKELEQSLRFDNPVIKTNAVKYIKRKFSNYQDYYYIDLITNYTNSAAMGLLYVLYDM